jgi:hypothetical protein
MNIKRALVGLVVLGALAAAVTGWQRARQLQSENERLRTELQRLKEQAATAAEAQFKLRDEELQQLRAEAKDVSKLRGEVTRLRVAAKDADALRVQNEQLRGAAAVAAKPPTTNAAPQGKFPRESWTFAGYATPESALVSAVWAMREGKTQVFLDSLTPEEQARMAKQWENKSEAEIAAEQQKEVSTVTSVRVIEQQDVSPDEVEMTFFIEGDNRMEVVKLKRIANDWKFGGTVRERVK